MTLRIEDARIIIAEEDDPGPPRVRYQPQHVRGQWYYLRGDTDLGHEIIRSRDTYDNWWVAAIYSGLPNDYGEGDEPSPTARLLLHAPAMLTKLIDILHAYEDDATWDNKADAQQWLEGQINDIKTLVEKVV